MEPTIENLLKEWRDRRRVALDYARRYPAEADYHLGMADALLDVIRDAEWLVRSHPSPKRPERTPSSALRG